MQKELKDKSIKILNKILPFIGLFVIVYIVYSIGVQNIVDSFFKINPLYLMAIIPITIFSYFLATYFWQLILKKQNIKIGFFKSMKIMLISGFYATVTPGRLGTWVKIPLLKKETQEPSGKVLINCLILSGIQTVSLFILMIIGTFFISDIVPIALPISILCLIVSFIFVILFGKEKIGSKIIYFSIKIFIPKRAKPYFYRLVKTFYKDFPRFNDMIYPFIVSQFLTLVYYFSYYLFALSIGINIGFEYFIAITTLIASLSLIPIPGFVGVRKLSLIYLFSLFGIAAADSFTLSLLPFLITGIPFVFIGFILALPWKKNSLFKQRKNLSFKKIITSN